MHRFLDRQLGEIVIGGGPDAIPLEAEIFHAERGQSRIRHHGDAPVLVVLNAAHLDAGIVDINPRIGEDIGPVHNEADGDEIAVTKGFRRFDDILRRRRIKDEHQFLQRNGRKEMRAFLLVELAAGIGAGHVGDAGFIPVNGLYLAIQQHFAASSHDLLRCRLPHLAGAEAGIKEITDQRLGSRRGLLAFEGADDRLAQGEPLDALGCPVGADLIARDAPDLLRVALEEHVEELLAKTVRHPLGKGHLRQNRLQPRLGVAEQDAESLHGPELEKTVHRLERVVEKLTPVVDAGEAWAIDEIVRHDLTPDLVHFLRLAEKAMSADIEAEAVGLHRAGDAADVAGVGFPDDDFLAGAVQFPRCRQAGGTGAHNNDWFGHITRA